MRSSTQRSASVATDFHQLMKDLLQSMSIDATSANRPTVEPEVYSFTFDGKTEINIFNPEPHSVDMLAKLGTLQNKKAYNTLLNLLSMNCYHRDGAPLNIGLDAITGKATLWMRIPLASLDLDKLTTLLSYILEKAKAVQQQLKGNASQEPAVLRNSTSHSNAFRINSSQLVKPLL